MTTAAIDTTDDEADPRDPGHLPIRVAAVAGGYWATFAMHPSGFGRGATAKEAVGDLILNYGRTHGIDAAIHAPQEPAR